MPPVFFIVTKPDAFPHRPCNDDGVGDFQLVGGKSVWKHCDINAGKTVLESEIRDLYNSVQRANTMIGGQNAPDHVSGIVDLQKLFAEQSAAHRMIDSIRIADGVVLMKSLTLALTGNPEWMQIPLFLVSPFGFYALRNVFSMPKEEKEIALREGEKTGALDDEEREIIAAAESGWFNHGTQGKDSDAKEDLSAAAEAIQEVQRRHDLSFEEIELTLKKRYKEIHQNDRPYGVEQFMCWLFAYTGMLRFVCDPANAGDGLILSRNAERCKRLREYDPGFAEREKQYTKHVQELAASLHHLEEQIQAKQTELDAIERPYLHLPTVRRLNGDIAELHAKAAHVQEELDDVKATSIDEIYSLICP